MHACQLNNQYIIQLLSSEGNQLDKIRNQVLHIEETKDRLIRISVLNRKAHCVQWKDQTGNKTKTRTVFFVIGGISK